jgi:hypothetical protein
MRIYVASSWRCPRLTAVIETLRAAGHLCYDFRHPEKIQRVGQPPMEPFTWSGIGLAEDAGPEVFLAALRSPRADRQWKLDMTALGAADALVLVLPCGASAHTEFGLAVGMGKRTLVLLDPAPRAELAYIEADFVTADLGALMRVLGRPGHRPDLAEETTEREPKPCAPIQAAVL